MFTSGMVMVMPMTMVMIYILWWSVSTFLLIFFLQKGHEAGVFPVLQNMTHMRLTWEELLWSVTAVEGSKYWGRVWRNTNGKIWEIQKRRCRKYKCCGTRLTMVGRTKTDCRSVSTAPTHWFCHQDTKVNVCLSLKLENSRLEMRESKQKRDTKKHTIVATSFLNGKGSYFHFWPFEFAKYTDDDVRIWE